MWRRPVSLGGDVIIYIAGRYSRREEFLVYRDELQARGHVVNSRWLNGGHQLSPSGLPVGDDGERLVEEGGILSPEVIALRNKFLQDDLEDVSACEWLISFTQPPRQPLVGRGGRHVEFGVVLGINAMRRAQFQKPIFLTVIGWRENLFHWHPDVSFFATWEHFKQTFD